MMSGVFIAAYTIWDRHGVAALRVAPVLFDAGTAFTQLALLTPFALRRWPEVAAGRELKCKVKTDPLFWLLHPDSP